MRHIPPYIEHIGYPESLKMLADHWQSVILDSLRKEGIPYGTGLFSVGEISEGHRLPALSFHWISETNEIISSLNIVIHDIKSLHDKYLFLDGNPIDRYFLLLRSFFHEFYRFREIFGIFVNSAQKHSVISKKERDSLRTNFNECFRDTFKLRNSIVHDSVIWTGRENHELLLHKLAWDADHALYKTGARKDTLASEPLKVVTNRISEELISVTNVIVLRTWVEIVALTAAGNSDAV